MTSPDERSLRREFGWFMLFALVVLAAGIGMRDPWPPDEPRFALVARQMLESGQWLFPHRGMELYADKPPMLMWTEAVWMWLTGGWRGAFLLTSLFSGMGTLALVAYLGRRLWNRRVGLHAAAIPFPCSGSPWPIPACCCTACAGPTGGCTGSAASPPALG
jgi:4-amino-4-deoxy-L-arabinose transferase-like glycosyltransferase